MSSNDQTSSSVRTARHPCGRGEAASTLSNVRNTPRPETREQLSRSVRLEPSWSLKQPGNRASRGSTLEEGRFHPPSVLTETARHQSSLSCINFSVER